MRNCKDEGTEGLKDFKEERSELTLGGLPDGHSTDFTTQRDR
jgi:hypothetical protein